jgi:hypothetical protein
MDSSRIAAIPFFADLRVMVDERRAQDAQRALAKQRAQDE